MPPGVSAAAARWWREAVRGATKRASRARGRDVLVSMVPIPTESHAALVPAPLHPERAHLENRAGRTLRGRRPAVGRYRGAQPAPALFDRQRRDRADRRPGGPARLGARRARRGAAGDAVRREYRPARHSLVLEPEPEHPGAGAARPGDLAGGARAPQARDTERARRERFPPSDAWAAALRAPCPLHRPLGPRPRAEAVLHHAGRPRARR